MGLEWLGLEWTALGSSRIDFTSPILRYDNQHKTDLSSENKNIRATFMFFLFLFNAQRQSGMPHLLPLKHGCITCLLLIATNPSNGIQCNTITFAYNRFQSHCCTGFFSLFFLGHPLVLHLNCFMLEIWRQKKKQQKWNGFALILSPCSKIGAEIRLVLDT